MINTEREIERVIKGLEEVQADIERMAKTAASAEATFKAEFAKSRLSHRYNEWKSKPTEAMLEDLATVDTEDQRKDYLIAQSLLDSRRSSLRALMAQLDGLRTLSAANRGV